MPQQSTEQPNKLRIVCCIHSLAGGGAERLMAGLSAQLAQSHDVTLLTLDSAATDRYEVPASVERVGLGVVGVSRNRFAGALANYRRVAAVRQALGQIAPQVVLSFCDQMNVVVLSATRKLKIPTVITEFTDPRHQKLPWVWNWLRRRLYPTAAVGVALNRSTLPIVRQWVRGPVAIISAAVDSPPADFSRRQCSPKRVVGLGRLSREKGFDRLVAAFAEVSPEFPDWELVIAGDGPERESIVAQIHAAGIQDKVRLVGWIKEVWGFLAEADIFALTSRYDGFPVALLEAMAGGIPVISVDCDSGPREIIRNEFNGLLVENSHESLCSGLRRLMQDPHLRALLGANGPDVLDRLSWEKFAADYEFVLRRAIAGNRTVEGLPGLS